MRPTKKRRKEKESDVAFETPRQLNDQQRQAARRALETPEKRKERQEEDKGRQAARRALETPEKRKERQEENNARQAARRALETPEKRKERQEEDKARQAGRRALETLEKRKERQEEDKARHAAKRASQIADTKRAALTYTPNDMFGSRKEEMMVICSACHAQRFREEPKGLCCSGQKVVLGPFPPPPPFLLSLINGTDERSANFIKNIRSYNGSFQMTSFGHKEGSVPGWNPTVRIQGQVYHRIGTLLAQGDSTPKYLQVYFLDSQSDQVEARCHDNLDRRILEQLTSFLNANNQYIQKLKNAKDSLMAAGQQDNFKVVIREDKRPNQEHARRFNAQQSSEIAILMDNEPTEHRDIVIRLKNGALQRISELHRSYEPLQYPLIFPYGTDGYNLYLVSSNGKKVSQQQFYAYHIQVRPHNYLHLYGRLYQQLLVDWYCKMETERLLFIRREQKALRADRYQDLRDALFANDGDPHNVGQRVILPSTFTGGPRYMHEKQTDAMTYVQKYGCADLFITMTCNPQWEEITANLRPGQSPNDRPELLSRVFRIKCRRLMDMIKKGIFGEVRAWLYTIEYQKRGLPHAHILVWLLPGQKIRPDEIDSVISAEIPDPQEDPLLHNLVTKHMIHGPCGAFNRHSPCMKDRACERNFPKAYRAATEQGEDCYPKYRRRHPNEGGQTAKKKVRGEDVTIGNEWVVPYNSFLLREFNCHINVEICSSIKSIKYVLKYVHKGTDQAVYGVQRTDSQDHAGGCPPQPVDEITQYQNGRYIGSVEASWRILGFDMHERFPSVERLAVHLENGQRVIFREENAAKRAQGPPPETTLTAFFKLCQKDAFARGLLYTQVPEHYTWDKGQKKWNARKRGTVIGRMYTISPKQGECYFLRLLLNVVHGPRSFQCLRTVDGQLCASYRDACQLRGLLDDDRHLELALEEASGTQTPKRLREFFAIIIVSCEPGSPLDLWNKFKDCLAEDILFQHRRETGDEKLIFMDFMYNRTLCEIEDRLLALSGKSAGEHALPKPNRDAESQISRDYWRETNYNREELSVSATVQYDQLTRDQKDVYTTFMNIVENRFDGHSPKHDNIVFLDAPGGTGKTFIINLILAKIRSCGKIALATASSGIAATLLQGGRTLHSTFKIPLNTYVNDSPTCGIKRGTTLANVIQDTAAIIVDEAPMTHKSAFEALDRTLKDIMKNQKPMGGIPTLYCGDFRQILPVVKKGTRADIVKACLRKSILWQHMQVKHLTTNMRAHLSGNVQAASFAKLLLDIGNGYMPVVEFPDTIKIPAGLGQFVNSVQDLKDRVFPNLLQNCSNSDWLSERTIISPLNECVNRLNDMLMAEFPGLEKLYTSVDTAEDENQAVLYPTEFLNSIDLSGIPPHKLCLKQGAPIIILRSLDPPKITNGTRCVVTRLHNNVIEALVSCGPYKGEAVLIPRIPHIPTDLTLPFTFRRLQFPIRPAFSMTINKSQGQTFKVVGVDLTVPCFTHGMFYVAASRTGSAESLIFLAPDNQTRNVVYTEVLQSRH